MTGNTATAGGTCDDCATDTWATLATGTCADNTVCGNQKAGGTRAVGDASRTVAGTCADCATDTWATAATGTCADNIVCGRAVPTGDDVTIRTSTDASRTVIGTCAPCATDTWADATGACAANTVCGDQLAVGGNPAVTRLTDDSRTVAGYCAACTSGTFATSDTTNCAANTICGNQLAVGGNPAINRLTGATRTAAGTCAACTSGTSATSDTTNCVSSPATQIPGTADGASTSNKIPGTSTKEDEVVVLTQTLTITGVTAAEVCIDDSKKAIASAIAKELGVTDEQLTITKCADAKRRRSLLAAGVDLEYQVTLPPAEAKKKQAEIVKTMATLEGESEATTSVLAAVAKATGKDVSTFTVKGLQTVVTVNKAELTANSCTAAEVANSDKSTTGSITGITGETVIVTCDTNFHGGGIATCATNGDFNILICAPNPIALPCIPTDAPHSDKSHTGSIFGNMGDVVSVSW